MSSSKPAGPGLEVLLVVAGMVAVLGLTAVAGVVVMAVVVRRRTPAAARHPQAVDDDYVPTGHCLRA